MSYVVKDHYLNISVPFTSKAKAEQLIKTATEAGRDVSLFKIAPDGQVGELVSTKRVRRASANQALFV